MWFNPNMYSDGKVCLSILGTHPVNSESEKWNSEISTTLQVLLSIQCIIMSNDVYFNEPGYSNEIGTPEGEERNNAYRNFVRYGNLKHAMIE